MLNLILMFHCIAPDSVGVVTRLWNGRPRNRGFIPGTSKRFFCSQMFKVVAGLSNLLSDVYLGPFPLGAKRPGRDDDLSTLSL